MGYNLHQVSQKRKKFEGTVKALLLVFENPCVSFLPDGSEECPGKVEPENFFSFLKGWPTSIWERRVKKSTGMIKDQPKMDVFILQLADAKEKIVKMSL